MPGCAVDGCSHKTGYPRNQENGVYFYRFPNRERSPVRNKKWVEFTGWALKPAYNNLVCSYHFDITDLEESKLMKLRLLKNSGHKFMGPQLNEGAVPSFLTTEDKGRCYVNDCLLKPKPENLHRFPHRFLSPDRFASWINFCDRDRMPGSKTGICSKHFKPEDLLTNSDGLQIPTEKAVPTVTIQQLQNEERPYLRGRPKRKRRRPSVLENNYKECSAKLKEKPTPRITLKAKIEELKKRSELFPTETGACSKQIGLEDYLTDSDGFKVLSEEAVPTVTTQQLQNEDTPYQSGRQKRNKGEEINYKRLSTKSKGKPTPRITFKAKIEELKKKSGLLPTTGESNKEQYTSHNKRKSWSNIVLARKRLKTEDEVSLSDSDLTEDISRFLQCSLEVAEEETIHFDSNRGTQCEMGREVLRFVECKVKDEQDFIEDDKRNFFEEQLSLKRTR